MANNAFSFSGTHAANYDKWLGPILFEPSSLELLKYIGPANIDSVLEISAGTGRLTRHLRKYFSQASEFVASDSSADMLAEANKNLNNKSIVFKVADAQQLPFPDNHFDLAVWQYGLMFLPDQQKGLKEAYRVLKPGGRIIFSTWNSQQRIPLLDLIYNQVLIPFFNEADSSRFRVPFSLHDPDILSNMLRLAGFRDESVIPIEFKSGCPLPDHIVNAFFLKHPISREVAAKDPNAVGRLAGTLMEKIAERFGERDLSFDLKAFIGRAEK